jgi:plastocyanin
MTKVGIHRLAIGTAALALGTVALAGCGGGGGGSQEASTTTTSTPKNTIQVSETEYKLTPKTVTIAKAGTYTIEATNNGTVDHALTVEGNGLEETRTDTIGPHDSSFITVDLEPGTYRLYCPIDGHQKLGMAGKIIVGGSAAQTTPTQTTSTTSGYGG